MLAEDIYIYMRSFTRQRRSARHRVASSVLSTLILEEHAVCEREAVRVRLARDQQQVATEATATRPWNHVAWVDQQLDVDVPCRRHLRPVQEHQRCVVKSVSISREEEATFNRSNTAAHYRGRLQCVCP